MICFGFSIQQHTHAHPVSIIPVLHYLSQEIQAGERAFSRWLQISLTASQFYTSAKEKKSKLNWAGYVHPRASQNRGRHTKKRGGEFLGAQPDSQTHRKIKCRVKASSIRWVFHSDTWKLWSEAASLRRGKHFKSKKTKQKPPQNLAQAHVGHVPELLFSSIQPSGLCFCFSSFITPFIFLFHNLVLKPCAYAAAT